MQIRIKKLVQCKWNDLYLRIFYNLIKYLYIESDHSNDIKVECHVCDH